MNDPLAHGTRIRKINSEPGKDTHGDGAPGSVLDHLDAPTEGPYAGVYGYFVIWDDLPGRPVFVTGNRIEPAAP